MEKLKVLLVAGNLEMRRHLSGILSADPELDVVAEVNNAYAARDKIIECDPDVMLLSQDLPRMPGITFLGKLMPQRSIATIVIAEPQYEDAAYRAGARDFIACGENYEILEHENICNRLKKAAGGEWLSAAKRAPVPIMTSVFRNAVNTVDSNNGNQPVTTSIIAIGASTGGTEAIATVVRGLRKDIPGIVMVQHMPEGYTQMYARRLDGEGEVSVKEAVSGDVVKPGQILLAPGDKQMRIVKINGRYQVECKYGPRVTGHCPSVDALFESVARVAGKEAIGVLMTGMGSDGAKGLLAMKNAGALTIGQDEKTCIVYGMPKVAYEIGAVKWQVPLEQIAQKIYYLLDKRQ
ncbi:MAG: chemotaxis-specific protein-glutamate methyltransferase CheB [Lachnospiraceae bacterium]|nr:chemotaxis-specific protein-glutamate methyltransferase CheB [Lachnospiraceae bacterium]